MTCNQTTQPQKRSGRHALRFKQAGHQQNDVGDCESIGAEVKTTSRTANRCPQCQQDALRGPERTTGPFRKIVLMTPMGNATFYDTVSFLTDDQ